MLEVFIDTKRSFNLKQAVIEAIENGEYESLRDDIRDCFTVDQVDDIEALLESDNIDEVIEEIIEEWLGDDYEDLQEAIRSFFAESTIDVQFSDDSVDMDVEEDVEYETELDGYDDNDDLEKEETDEDY